jgi:diguanylate cyclase (GGDEF)-like protein
MDRLPFRWSTIAICALVLGGMLTAILTVIPPLQRAALAAWACAVVALLALGGILGALHSLHRSAEQTSWRLFAAAVAAFLCWSLYHVLAFLPHAPTPDPKLALILFILTHLLLWGGVVARTGHLPSDWLGKLVFSCDVVLSVGAITVIGSLYALHHLPPDPRAMGLYAVTAVLTLLAIVWLTSLTVPPHSAGTRTLLGWALGIILVSDIGQTYLGIGPTSPWYAPLIGAWVTGYLLLAASALWESALPPRAGWISPAVDDPLPFASLSVPAWLIITALGLLMFMHTPTHVLHHFTLTSVSILTVLLLLRSILALWWHHNAYQRLHEELHECHRQMRTDALTGLVNKSFLLEHMRNEMARATQERQPFAVLFCDIDFFKLINDAHGHPVGDKALCAVGSCLRRQTRATDIVARFGGEEFVILMRDTNLEHARLRAERLRKAVEVLPFQLPSGVIHHMTISLGVAAYPETSNTIESLLADADDAMLKAKDTGRNRIIVAERQEFRFAPLSGSSK